MSAPSIGAPSAAGPAASERVAVREVHDAAVRALRAVGVSAGEAAAAAAIAVEAEVQGWGGLDAVLREVRTVRTRAADAAGPVADQHDGGFVVADPQRGPLLLGRAGFDLAVGQAESATRVGVSLRRLRYHSVLLCFALELAAHTRGNTALVEVDGAGAESSAVVVAKDGRIHDLTDGAGAARRIPVPAHRDPARGDGAHHPITGLHITECHAAAPRQGRGAVISTPNERAHRRDLARHSGLHVPAGTWAALHESARLFLVAEPTDTPPE